jgi:transposase
VIQAPWEELGWAHCYELTDFEWLIIEPLLPTKPHGVPRTDDRRVLNGIHWRLRPGSPHPGALWPSHDRERSR